MNKITKDKIYSELKDVAHEASWSTAAFLNDFFSNAEELEGAAELFGGSEIGLLINVTKLIHTTYKEFKGYTADNLPPNPFFVSHGICEKNQPYPPSPKTHGYMTHRVKMKVGSAAVSTAGAIASTATQVDVSAIGKSGSSIGSSIKHIQELKKIAAKYPKSQTVQQWIDTIVMAKNMKSALSAADLASGLIPVPVASLATTLLTSTARAGVKISQADLLSATAMKLHWLAFIEMKLSTIHNKKDQPVKPNG
ncbi:MAG: hypothetical protein O3C05_03415, partial [Proteobacteria bacterium]|nr:hypothetical protein [Pseudomonadota bacterium]